VDTIVEFDIGCLPELAVPGPVLMATDEQLIFSFNATRLTPAGRRADAGRAVVKVNPCLAFKFGYPNDEALGGHPLYARGFHGVAVYEVLESSWVAALAEQNRVKFPDSDLSGWGVRHFLLSFHESTLEALGRGLDVSLTEEPLAVVVTGMQSWLFGAA
jgi:hypothetical protein